MVWNKKRPEKPREGTAGKIERGTQEGKRSPSSFKKKKPSVM